MTSLNRIYDRLIGLVRRKPAPTFGAPLRPEVPIAVIGDVHGRDDLLARLLDRLEREAADHRIVLVGDYIDRGEESRSVIARLRARPDLICLKGNHEAMCQGFLEDPEKQGAMWLRNGGLQTLASFGVGGIGPTANDPRRLAEARDGLAAALGEEAIGWLRDLALTWRSGNIGVVHAAADPMLPFNLQSERSLLWGHPAFQNTVRQDDLWIVHGHTITDEPDAQGGRIAIDTGAYASGRLTAALIAPDELRFVEAT